MTNPFFSPLKRGKHLSPYPDGNPANPFALRPGEWVGAGKVYYVGRHYWESVAEDDREVMRNPGVYILAGGERDIYIGQAENFV